MSNDQPKDGAKAVADHILTMEEIGWESAHHILMEAITRTGEVVLMLLKDDVGILITWWENGGLKTAYRDACDLYPTGRRHKLVDVGAAPTVLYTRYDYDRAPMSTRCKGPDGIVYEHHLDGWHNVASPDDVAALSNGLHGTMRTVQRWGRG